MLHAFAVRNAGDCTVVEKSCLGSVKVLGEGVDTSRCDCVYFADVRGSMPDLVQAVGRALRMQACEGKTASLVVPVLLGPGETPDNRLTSKPFAGLARLREPSAHTTPASSRPRRAASYQPCPRGRGFGSESKKQGAPWQGISGPAKTLLRFSTPRAPARPRCIPTVNLLETAGA